MDQKTIAFIVIAFIVGGAIGYFYATNYATPAGGQQVLTRGAARTTATPLIGGGISCPSKSCELNVDCGLVSGDNATCSGRCDTSNGKCSWNSVTSGV